MAAGFRRCAVVFALLLAGGLLAACAPGGARVPLPAGVIALPYGVPGAQNRSGQAPAAAPGPAIAFSGGGQKGAYGAGLMVGWTARGDRPEFSLVTGVSTGAILALFTFLGPEHDGTLTELYTRYQTRDLVRRNLLSGLLGGTALDNAAPYRALIDSYVSDRIIDAIATEAKRGRKLLIGSTDLDAKAPYLWDVTAIAGSGHPQRAMLIRDIIQASSAIPAIFPPVVIPMLDRTGARRDRLHVDGGITRPFVFRPMTARGPGGAQTDYVVINEFIGPRFHPVRDDLRGVTGAALATAVTYSARTELLYFADEARRSGARWRGAAIPASFDRVPTQEFDPAYMKALFTLGQRQARAGRAFGLDAHVVADLRRR